MTSRGGPVEIGVYTFADVSPARGHGLDAGQRLRNLVEEIAAADRLGLDVFGVGEHHRPDYASSAPAVVLAAGAAVSRRIRLTSAVTVLSSDDPVRVFQQYATLDGISNGRAEIMAGRGSFIESFPLFGYQLEDYDELFTEKLDLLLQIREQERVTWSGRLRAPLQNAGIYPRPVQDPLPLWIAVGGTPQSVVRAAVNGLPLALAIIGGEPAKFAPLFDLYRRAGQEMSVDPALLRTGLNMHGFIAESAEEAREAFFPGYAEVMTRIGAERGWPPLTRAQFEASCGPRGHLLVGTPEEVAQKIIALHQIFRNDRFLIQMGLGSLPHERMIKAIELLAMKVAPLVRGATEH
jgi:probable LLM family oxidoreductase